MQTFLPWADYRASAASLDQKRLGKQRVETMQILNALTQPDHGWTNHPAVRMWRGYEVALFDYQEAVCSEWTGRGYRDTCLLKTAMILTDAMDAGIVVPTLQHPPWRGLEVLHQSHRSNLVRKDADHYGSQFVDADPEQDYYWPV